MLLFITALSFFCAVSCPLKKGRNGKEIESIRKSIKLMDQLIGKDIFKIIIVVMLSLAKKGQQQAPNPLIIRILRRAERLLLKGVKIRVLIRVGKLLQ